MWTTGPGEWSGQSGEVYWYCAARLPRETEVRKKIPDTTLGKRGSIPTHYDTRERGKWSPYRVRSTNDGKAKLTDNLPGAGAGTLVRLGATHSVPLRPRRSSRARAVSNSLYLESNWNRSRQLQLPASLSMLPGCTCAHADGRRGSAPNVVGAGTSRRDRSGDGHVPLGLTHPR